MAAIIDPTEAIIKPTHNCELNPNPIAIGIPPKNAPKAFPILKLA